jgi:hypothetical protein
MSNLTDSEQIKLLQELYDTTRTKIETVLKKYKLDTVPAEIIQIRQRMDKQHGKTRAIKDAIFQGLGVTKSVLDKLLKD